MSESKKHPFEILPHLQQLSKEVLFGYVWEDEGLSKRDRSLATCAILAAMYCTDELDHHMSLQLENGMTPKEMKSLITHVAFYAGWPSAMNAGRVAVDALPHDEARRPRGRVRRGWGETCCQRRRARTGL